MNFPKYKQLSLLLFVFFLAQLITAQLNPAFKHITINQGLSNNQINCIFKDSNGFMWFGTGSGLNRYDGISFKTFFHSANMPNGLITNSVLGLQEDINKNLWLRTTQGYCVYIAEKESFVFPAQKYLSSYGINDSISFVFIDNNKCFWLNTETKTLVLNISNKTPKITALNLPQKNITGIYHSNSEIYLVFENGLIYVLNDTNYKTLKTVDLNKHFQLPAVSDLQVFVDNDNDLWLFQRTNPNGIYFYSFKTDAWQLLSTTGKSGYKISANTIKSITADSQNNVWIATDHGGINIINKITDKIIYLEPDAKNPRNIAEKSMVHLYFDSENIMWAGSYKSGISYYSDRLFKFNHIQPASFNINIDFDNDINCFEEDRQGNFWYGSNNKGLLKVDKTTGKYTLFKHSSEKSGLSGNVIVSLLHDRTGKLWIGTYQNGLNLFDGQKFTVFKQKPIGNQSISNNSIWDLLEDHDGNIWIATLGNGIDVYDPEEKKFRNFNSANCNLPSDYIIAMFQTKNNDILIGSAHGLCIYRNQSEKFERIQGNFSGTQKLLNQNILSVYEDSRQLIWVGTREGLHMLNPKTDQLTWITKHAGISDNVIYAIIEDDNQNIWISTPNGISNIQVGISPTSGDYTFNYVNYDEHDGLQGKDFNERSVFKSSAGNLLFGGKNGYNIIKPSNIRYNQTKPKVVFTDFLLFNKSVQIDSIYRNRKILTKSISQTSEINLKYNENIFTIEFAALSFLHPAKTTYSYMLEGFEKYWVTIKDKKPSVSYTNLDPGTYLFKIKASNNDGFWNEEPIVLSITVHPPFWKTTFAYFIYSVVVIIMLIYTWKYFLLRFRTRICFPTGRIEPGVFKYLIIPLNELKLMLKINKLLAKRADVHREIIQKREIIPSEIQISSLDEKLLQKAIKCVEEYMENPEFSVEMLSSEMGMSRVHLYKKLLSITGKTPIEFIRIIRLKRAAQLLKKSQLSVSEIAYQVGFNNPKYFSRYFKDEFGVLPSVYAKNEN